MERAEAKASGSLYRLDADLSEQELEKQPQAGGLFMIRPGVRGIAELPFSG